MLALVAVFALKRDCIRQALARLYVAVAAPELLGDTVHRGEIPPACHVAERPRAHHFDRARVPQDRVVPVASELPDVAPCPWHVLVALLRRARTRVRTH